MTLLLHPSIFHPLAFLAGPIPSSSVKIRYHVFPLSVVSCFPACIDSSSWVAVSAAHNPDTSCTKLMPLLVGQLFSPCRASPNAMCPVSSGWCLASSPSHLGPSLTLPWHFEPFAASPTAHATICVCCHPPLRSMLLCSFFLSTNAHFSMVLVSALHNLSIPPQNSEFLPGDRQLRTLSSSRSKIRQPKTIALFKQRNKSAFLAQHVPPSGSPNCT